MKYSRLFLPFIFLLFAIHSNSQSWQWFENIGGGGSGINAPDEQILDLITDSLGNTYICGVMKVAPLYNGNILPWEGNDDGFVAKFNCSGQLVWYRSCGSSIDQEKISSLALDKKGQLYLSGFIHSDPTHPATIIDTTFNNTFVGSYIIKLDSSGNRKWIWFAGDSTTTACQTLCRIEYIRLDRYDNIYFSGFNSTSCQIFPSIPNSGDSASLFLAKMDTLRHPKWYKAINIKLSLVLQVDSIGNCYYTGDFLDPVIINGNVVTPYGWDLLLAKYDSSGNYQWHYHNGNSTSYGQGEHITFDSNNHIWLSARIGRGTVWGIDTVKNDPNFTSGRGVIAAIEFDQNGNPLHEYNGYHSISNSDGSFIDLQKDYIYFGGSHNGVVKFGNDSATSVGLRDIFIARINKTSRQVNLITTLSGLGSTELVNQVGHDAAGNLYLGGCFDGTMTINSINYPTNGGQTDAFIAKFGNANCATVGFNELTTDISIKAYPNPTGDKLNLDLGVQNVINGSYELISSIGQVIQTGKIYQGANQINTEKLPPGFYFVRIIGNGFSKTIKVSKVN